MRLQMLKSKIHRAWISGKALDYQGSLTIDETLMQAAGIRPYERIQVLNIHNGRRFETYAIAGPADSGIVQLNGGAARWGEVGDPVIVLSYAWLDESELTRFQPRIVLVDEHNRPLPPQSSLPESQIV